MAKKLRPRDQQTFECRTITVSVNGLLAGEDGCITISGRHANSINQHEECVVVKVSLKQLLSLRDQVVDGLDRELKVLDAMLTQNDKTVVDSYVKNRFN